MLSKALIDLLAIFLTPQLHLIKALVDLVKALVDLLKALVHHGQQIAMALVSCSKRSNIVCRSSCRCSSI